MSPRGQDVAGDGKPAAALAYLGQAASALQRRLGHALWERLDKRTRSCLVTSQVFQAILEEVAAERDKTLDSAGKHVGQLDAPEIDFSPAILCLFKAIEIEIERKIYRPFRAAHGPEWGGVPRHGGVEPDVESLESFLRHGGPSPSLKYSAMLFSRLRGAKAGGHGLPGLLKSWMRANLLRPDRLWRDGRLSQRLQRAVDTHRNAAAHTGRFTPLEAQKAVAELWGEPPHSGLIRHVLRSIEARPVAASGAVRIGDGADARAEVRRGLFVDRVILLKPRYWLLDATDHEVGDRYLLTVIPGDFDAAKSASKDFRTCRLLADDHLLPVEKWFPADGRWGRRIVIASPCSVSYRTTGERKRRPLFPAESLALAAELSRASAVLHNAGLVHGFISPYTAFRDPEGRWVLGGQFMTLLARQGVSVYAYPRATAPEVDPLDARTRTATADVYSIAATACVLRAGRAGRNTGPPRPQDADALFPPGPARTALGSALSPDPASRPSSAAELYAALTGQPVNCGAASGGPHPVVISYSRKDEKAAEALITALASRGVRAWRDQDMIPGGAQWRDAIVSAIDGCRVVIFLLSKHSMASEQVPKELDIAADAHKTILPVCLDDAKVVAQFRYLLAGTQRLDYSAGAREDGLTQLLRALREHGVMPGH